MYGTLFHKKIYFPHEILKNRKKKLLKKISLSRNTQKHKNFFVFLEMKEKQFDAILFNFLNDGEMLLVQQLQF